MPKCSIKLFKFPIRLRDASRPMSGVPMSGETYHSRLAVSVPIVNGSSYGPPILMCLTPHSSHFVIVDVVQDLRSCQIVSTYSRLTNCRASLFFYHLSNDQESMIVATMVRTTTSLYFKLYNCLHQANVDEEQVTLYVFQMMGVNLCLVMGLTYTMFHPAHFLYWLVR